MELNQNQKRAVEYLGGPLLVLAGPGTGKTQLLSHKVAYILQNTDTNPENILCMTFTENGALNMRERLKSIIGSDGLKVNISTYHAFGSEILALYTNYSLEYERRIDSAIDEVTRFKIIKKFRDSLSANDILRKDNVKDIISVISAAKSAGLTDTDLTMIAGQNEADSKVLSEAISPLLKKIVPYKYTESLDGAYRPIWKILEVYTEAKVILKNIERSICAMARDLKEAMYEAESSGKIKPLTKWKDSYFEKDGRGNYRLKDRVANKKLASVAKVMTNYNEYLHENGLFDFDDMIIEAAHILAEDAGFRATLQERYQFIMLDEFQDTNPAQFQIIKELTNYDKPQIMAVGDDDQAIYEFQGALSTNMIDFQNHYKAEVIPLVDNYRSTQEILDFSRDIINQATDRFADKVLTAHKDNLHESQIYRFEFLSSDMEYAFVADEIAKLIKAGARQSEIAVISYKTKYFLPLLPYLKTHPEINIAYEKRDDLFNDEQIHQILTIAQYVFELAHERNENTSIVEILSYPFWHLPVLEVVKLVGAARQSKKSIFEFISASENSEITEVANFLANLVAKSFTEPLEIWLDYLIGTVVLDGFRSPFMEYYVNQGEYSAFSLYEKIAALRGKLRQHFGDKSLMLVDLVSMVKDYTEAEMPLNMVSPYKDADEAVQILSAHKAKGLEFKYVFIISADHTAWGKGKGNNNLLSLPKNLVQIRHTGMTDGERLRVLYVALTRAEERLYITNSLKDFNGKSPDRLEYLLEHEEEGEVYSEFLPSRKVQTFYAQQKTNATVDNLRNFLKPYVTLTPDMKALYLERTANYKMSASSLTSFIDIVYAGPQTFFRDYVLMAPREPETESLALGNLIHATFEAVTNRKLDNNSAIQFFLDELEGRDLSTDIKQLLREKGPLDLEVALKEFGDILSQGKAEINLTPDKISISGVPVTGKIDHMIINEESKTIQIYDYKTGGYHKEKWTSHATLYKYMLQLEFYRLLLNHSRDYAKYKVTKAHILFVTPDRDGQVYDKVYDFDGIKPNELLRLMQVVYEQITTLKFIDNPEIFIAADNTKSLKDIKQFVEKLVDL